jgi:hypothetical protein
VSLLRPGRAEAVLRPATAPELAGVTGRYIVRDAERRSPEISYDRDLQQRVWNASHACCVSAPRDRNSPAVS